MKCATPIRIVGAVLDTDAPIRLERITDERWSAAEPCSQPYMRVATQLRVAVASWAEGPLPTPTAMPNANPATLRHVPYLKGRLSDCGRSDPLWLDLGQTIHNPCEAAFSIVAPAGWITSPRSGQEITPAGWDGVAAFHFWQAWILAELVPLQCCPGSQEWTLTDSVAVPNSGDVGTLVTVPPHARCLTIHKGDGVALDFNWIAGGLVVGTSGMPTAASQLSLVVPDVPTLEIRNASGESETILLVWGCERA